MLRRLRVEFVRLFADLVRRIAEAWASGEIEEAKKEKEWDDQRSDFKDALKKWRKK